MFIIWIDAIMLQAASPKPIITTFHMAKKQWAITCMKLICILLALRSSVTCCATTVRLYVQSKRSAMGYNTLYLIVAQ